VTRDLDEAARLADVFAPEHLEIMTAQPRKLAAKISNAGAIFLGPNTPQVVGDYMAGPSHVLPTGGAARFMTGLSVRDFLGATSVISYTRKALQNIADDVARIAEAEGLAAHAASVRARFQARVRS
jgi:histidinol dehydrogenase